MFQFAFEAVLFKFTYEASQFAPLLQLPPTRAQTAHMTPKAHHISLFFHFLLSVTHNGGRCPPLPLCAAYAAEGCSQEREAPTPQCADEAVSSKDTTEASQYAPSLQRPPTRAIATIVMFIQ